MPPPQRLSRVSQAQHDESCRLINSGILPKTLADHHRAFVKWTTFLNTFNDGIFAEDPYLKQESSRDCTTILSLYITHLRTHTLHPMLPDPIRQHLSQLRSNWTAINMSGSFLSMSSLEVTRILKALPATDDELRIVLEKKRRRQKFPITMEMSAVTRQLHWTEQLRTWTMAKSLDLMGAALGMSLQVEATSRGTNWVGPRAIKTQDLRFQVGVGKRQDNGSYEAAREVRGHLLTNIICEDFIEDDDTAPVIDFDRVLMVNMDHLQTKPGKPVEDIRVARRTDEESQILNDIITWLALANPQQGEPFLTRRGHHITSAGNTRRDIKKIITGAMVTNMMKDTAVRLGLNPELFSLSSLRKTGVTNMSKKGADIETINDRTGHQPG